MNIFLVRTRELWILITEFSRELEFCEFINSIHPSIHSHSMDSYMARKSECLAVLCMIRLEVGAGSDDHGSFLLNVFYSFME
jgi:hypothetical protein